MTDLVEFIYKKSKYAMISDIVGRISIDQLKEWYSELDIYEYSMEQWNNAFTYILSGTSRQVIFHSYDEIEAWMKDEAMDKSVVHNIDLKSIAGKYQYEINICKLMSKDPDTRKLYHDLLSDCMNNIPDKYVLFTKSLLNPVFENNFSKEDHGYLENKVRLSIMNDLFTKAEKSRAGCNEVRKLISEILTSI